MGADMRKSIFAIFIALVSAIWFAPGAIAAYNCTVRAAGQKYSSCNQVTRTLVMRGSKCQPTTNPQMCGGKCTPTVASDCNATSCEPACVTQTECDATCNGATEYRDIATNTCKKILIVGTTDFARCMKCTSKSDMLGCLADAKLSC